MEVNINDRQLNEFLEREWDRGMLYLGACFGSISMEEREDIIQESMIALANNIRNGKYEQQDATLHTYFIAICRNQALKRTKKPNKVVPYIDGQKQSDNSDFGLSDSLNYLTESKDRYIPEHIDVPIERHTEVEHISDAVLETTINKYKDKEYQ